MKQTPEGDDISGAMALQLQKEIYNTELDTDGKLERVYL